jgi:hypothetical protein
MACVRDLTGKGAADRRSVAPDVLQNFQCANEACPVDFYGFAGKKAVLVVREVRHISPSCGTFG